MSNPKLSFALFGNEYQPQKAPLFINIIKELQKHGALVYIDSTFYRFLNKEAKLPIDKQRMIEGNNFNVDYAISVGGDGTFLKAAHRIGAKNIPLIGVNTGRLGFLAGILPTEIKDTINSIYEGKYFLERHSVLQLEKDGEPISGSPCALNEIAILKLDHASMITIKALVNNAYLVTYQADGLIVATPTGSTAYNLSNAGPIMTPSTPIICLTPVAPHSLNIRPIVLNDNSVITLTVVSRSHHFLAAIDGKSYKLTEGTKICIRKAPYSIQVVKLLGQRFFDTLREKLMWGADTRVNI